MTVLARVIPTSVVGFFVDFKYRVGKILIIWVHFKIK